MSVTKPLPLIGGKRHLVKTLLRLIPSHRVYVEPFAGGATLFFAKEPSEVEILNDINGEIVNFYRVLKHHWPEFWRQIRPMFKSRRLFEDLKKTPPETLTDIQRAVRFFYLLKNNFGAKLSSFNYVVQIRANRKAFRPRTLKAVLYRAFRRLGDAQVENLDFEECIRRYDTEETFFYCDPPYYGYESMYPGAHREDFDRLVRVLRGIRGKWLLSNVDHPRVREAFKGYHILEAKVPWSTGNRFRAKQKVGREILIANYDISTGKIVEKSRGGSLKAKN